jgi:hypothetical protein
VALSSQLTHNTSALTNHPWLCFAYRTTPLATLMNRYVADGVLESALVHEASHTSLDGDHALAPEWLAAAAADPVAISNYARDNPHREDIAESVGPFLAVTFCANVVAKETVDVVRRAIPNRIAYLARHAGLTMEPLAKGSVGGACGCGATKYAAGPGQMWGIFVCHCSLCPRGSNGTAWCAVPRCTFSGPPLQTRRTTGFAERGACSACGEPVMLRYDAESCTDWVALSTVRLSSLRLSRTDMSTDYARRTRWLADCLARPVLIPLVAHPQLTLITAPLPSPSPYSVVAIHCRITLHKVQRGMPGLPWTPGDPLPPAQRKCHIEVSDGDDVASDTWGDGIRVCSCRGMACVPDPCAPEGWAEGMCFACFLGTSQCRCPEGVATLRPFPEPVR